MTRRAPKHLGPRSRRAARSHRTQFDPEGSHRSRLFEGFLLKYRFAHSIMHCLAVAGLTALIYPRFVAPYRWRLTRYDMPFANLPPEFAGYKILQLSDFHLGRTRVSYIESVITRCLQEKPDLIVLTGDLIHYHPDGLAALPQILNLLKPATSGGPAPSSLDTGHRTLDTPPVLAIFGNHDYHEYSWRHIGKRSAHRSIHRRLAGLVQSAGITLLRNQLHTIRRGSALLQIVGMDELWAGNFDPAAAFAHVDPAQPCVCLQHNPDGCAQLQNYPWQWMLCGHSHGGQLDLPILGPMYIPQEHRHWLRGFFHFPAGPSGGGGGGPRPCSSPPASATPPPSAFASLPKPPSSPSPAQPLVPRP